MSILSLEIFAEWKFVRIFAPLQRIPKGIMDKWYVGRVVRQRSAKPCTAVRFRHVPHTRTGAAPLQRIATILSKTNFAVYSLRNCARFCFTCVNVLSL